MEKSIFLNTFLGKLTIGAIFVAALFPLVFSYSTPVVYSNENDEDSSVNIQSNFHFDDDFGDDHDDDDWEDDDDDSNDDDNDNPLPPPAACTQALDVVLVIDRSTSMDDDSTNPPQPITDAKSAAKAFIDNLNPNTDKVAVVSYAQNATLNKALTSDFVSAKSAITNISLTNWTNIGGGVETANAELTANGRVGVRKVIILLTDGKANKPDNNPEGFALTKATEAKNNGVIIYTIGLGRENIRPMFLKQIATSPAHYYFAPSGTGLKSIYNAIAAKECALKPLKIVATKIVCSKESDLPNWGLGGPDVGAHTATDYVAAHPSCRLEQGWNFQWGYSNVTDPGRDHIDAAGNGWTTFGPTSQNGNATIEIGDLKNSSKIWVREVLKDGFVPFTYDATHSTNEKNISAEMYCDTDVLNYDNYDSISNPTLEKTYHCVAFNVLKNKPPVITLVGATPMTVIVGLTFVDPGATASDPEDGNITTNIVKTGTVNTAIVGSYAIHYNVQDSEGLAATQKTRMVNVVPPPPQCSDNNDNDGDGKSDAHDPGCHEDDDPNKPYSPNDPDENAKPVITVTPPNPTSVTQNSPFSDLGATAHDQEDGNITANIVKTGVVDTAMAGSYTIKYDVSDSKGQAADQKTRTVNVVPPLPACADTLDNDGDGKSDAQDPGCHEDDDPNKPYSPNDPDENAKPVITVTPPSPVTIIKDTVYIDAGATAEDQEDGNITANIVKTGTVDISTIGVHVVKYDVLDSKSKPADQKTRTVNVVPIPSVCSDTLDNDGDGKFDDNDPGCHEDDDPNKPYKPNDPDENTKPVITVLGDNPATVIVGATFTDPGATANDQEDGNITANIVKTGSVDTSTIGSYVITYDVADSKGQAADQKSRTVNVVSGGGGGGGGPRPVCDDGLDNDGDGKSDAQDPGCHEDDNLDKPWISSDPDENSKPVIAVVGDNPFGITQGNAYSDSGATAFDQEDGNITANIVAGGSIDTDTPGSYTKTYNVSDSKGRAADQKSRTVNVTQKPSTGCTSNCGGGGGGGAPIHLVISNEKVTVVANGTAEVTWDTNLQATSHVLYDIDSYVSATAPFSQYKKSTTETAALVTKHKVTVTGLTTAKYYFRPHSNRSNEAAFGKELEINATGGGIVLGAECSKYLNSYIHIGLKNDPSEVRKLQTFLRDVEGHKLAITGVYTAADFDAVKKFQKKYETDVLNTWALPGPTGYVYYTTQKKINEIFCKYEKQFPLNSIQLEEVYEFRNRAPSSVTAEVGGDASTDMTNSTTPPSISPVPKAAKEIAGSGVTKESGKNVLENIFDTKEGTEPAVTLEDAEGEKGEEKSFTRAIAAITLGALGDSDPSALLWMLVLLAAGALAIYLARLHEGEAETNVGETPSGGAGNTALTNSTIILPPAKQEKKEERLTVPENYAEMVSGRRDDFPTAMPPRQEGQGGNNRDHRNDRRDSRHYRRPFPPPPSNLPR